MNRQINSALLVRAAQKATKSSSHALSLLVGDEVTVRATQASHLPLDKLVSLIARQEETRVIAFSQLLSGVKGAALLIMSQTDALRLVDSLTKQPMGTTQTVGDIEKSAIKETLNILSNSQLTALAKDLGITVNVLPPNLISRGRIAEVLDYLASHKGKDTEIVVFETSLSVAGQASQVTMFIAFDGELAGIVEPREQP